MVRVAFCLDFHCLLHCLGSVLSNTVSHHPIPAQSHPFVEIDHETISMVILLPSADSFKKGRCCQLQARVYARIIG